MTDFELLELAARAAGKGNFWQSENPCKSNAPYWNPLTDDGDALRLAVKLGLLIDGEYNGGIGVGSASYEEVWECKKVDPYTATRRAIVRAAAEIGKGMK